MQFIQEIRHVCYLTRKLGWWGCACCRCGGLTDGWALLGLAMLGVRLVQGWIYWDGASRRLIYSAGKLDSASSGYMAHKMTTAIPGAIFGTGDMLTSLLHYPTLLYISIIAFTLIELMVGVAARSCTTGWVLTWH